MYQLNTFLSQTAQHYVNTPEKLKKTVFVFPSRRSLIHFMKEMRTMGAKGQLVGTTINDFFYQIHGTHPTDKIRLVLELYECYKQINPKAESLDDFIFWGNIMIGDFDNLDKYMADAKGLFVNISDLKSMQDTLSYLTEGQRSAIEHFISHFKDRSGRVTVAGALGKTDMKERFLQIWDLMYPLYSAFRQRLLAAGMSYEGMVYRTLADSLNEGADIKTLLSKAYPDKDRFVFVGLNALNECEKTVLRKMRESSLAEYVWDFSSDEITNPDNKASLFIHKNLKEFPQAFAFKERLSRPHVTVISVPSGLGQTKLAPQILRQCEGEAEQTAFVLPDEELLMPLLSAMPQEVDTVNVTMGYPLKRSAIYSLIKALSGLQLSAKSKDGKEYFYHKAVSDILSNSLVKSILTDDEKNLADAVKAQGQVSVEQSSIGQGPLLGVLFRLVVTNTQAPSSLQNTLINQYLKQAVMTVGALLGTSDKELMELDFAKRCAEALDQLAQIQLPVKATTYLQALDRLLSNESVPFEGEPLKGLQVMGTLETRALDFRNLVIFSANEDVFPHRSADNSFIPPELRKAFGMPTIEYQDAVWAYYFYRLLQRAEKVWMVYDSRTEGLLSGEESRYIKQLEYHFGFETKRLSAVSPVSVLEKDSPIEKTQDDIDALKAGHLSASSLQSYLVCPAKFYYQAVKGLKDDEDVVESLDAAMLGTVFHGIMERLYKGRRCVTQTDLGIMLASTDEIRSMIREGIMNEAKVIEISGRNLVIEEVVLEYVLATLRHDRDLLIKSGSKEFRILGLERFVKTEIEGLPFIGFIDRIDTYLDGKIRIVDYKTGHVENDDIMISEKNAQSVVEKLFGESNYNRPKIALQLYLYGVFAKQGIVKPGEMVVNSIYSTARLMTDPLPDVEECGAFTEKMQEGVKNTLAQITDLSVPWKRTSDKHICSTCQFRSICGR